MRFPYRGAGIALLRQKDDTFEVLLGKRSVRLFKGCWTVPGGGFEKGRDADDMAAAKREFLEETSAEVPFDAKTMGKWTLRAPFFKWTTFVMLTEKGDFETHPDEFSELRWTKLGETGKMKTRPFTGPEMRKVARLCRKTSLRKQ